MSSLNTAHKEIISFDLGNIFEINDQEITQLDASDIQDPIIAELITNTSDNYAEIQQIVPEGNVIADENSTSCHFPSG